MIGFYNYTVILTYMSLISSSLGMIFAVNYRFKLALLSRTIRSFRYV